MDFYRMLTREIYKVLTKAGRVTATGVCHVLRGMDLPPSMDEAEASLRWLCRNGYAQAHADVGFGAEYTPRATQEGI